MPKFKFNISKNREYYKRIYERKYYDIWINRFAYKELDYQQNEYIMRKFWKEGMIAGFIVANTKGSDEFPNGLPCFTLLAPAMYNIYDYPTHATLINTRGVPFIPATLQEIDKDIVVFYCNKLRKGVYFMIEPLLDKLAMVDTVIKLNLNAHKVPYIIPTSPEDKDRIERIWNDIQNDQDVIFVPNENFDKLKILTTGNQYIVDKLEALKDKLENELKEYFGFNSLPVTEKKEHMIDSEVSSNNEFTSYRYDSLKLILEDNAERFKNLFGVTLTLVENKPEEKEPKEEEVIEDED